MSITQITSREDKKEDSKDEGYNTYMKKMDWIV
jgi:hypothetical protein